MFLKSLDIFGFKSFADRTVIEFSDGISALLGPNGCGKSNVVDAIKWVVGEQSAKSLRADSMEDIIFNGTETRKALSVAEVTITISNETGTLPLDVPEVAIKRRLYRSGESEYYINGRLAKLKEVRELFWDTGIGKSAYSVMEQGKIDQILSSKPEDRRYLFEEAAGITKHKVRVREAETKLERTEENMRQIEAVVAEVKHSHDSLKRQAEKTVSYRELKDSIFELERDVYLLRLRQFMRDKDKYDTEFERKKTEREALKAESESLSASMTESIDAVSEMEAQLVEKQKTLYGLAVEKNGAEKHKSLVNDRIRELKSKLEQLDLRAKNVREKIAALREEEEDKEAELSEYRQRLKDADLHIDEFESSIKAASLTLRGNDQEAARCAASVRQIEEEITQARLDLDSLTEAIVQELDQRLKDTGYSSADRQALETEIRSLIERTRTRIDSKATLLEDLTRSVSYSGKAMGDFSSTLHKAAEELLLASGSLAELSGKFEHYRDATPSFLDEFLSPQGIITKKRSIDAAIASKLNTIDTLKASIDSLGEENKSLTGKIEGWRRTLEDARLAKTRVQTQMSAAQEALAVFRREIAGQEATLREHEAEVFTESRRLDELREEIADIDSELAEIESKGKALAADMERLEKAIAAMNSELGERRMDASRLADRIQAVQAELETIHLSIAQNETEIKNIRENFMELYSRDLGEYEGRMFELRNPIFELRDALVHKKAKLKDLGSVNLMAPEEYKEVKERYDFLSEQMADLTKARDDLKQITDEIRTESAELFLETYNKIKRNFHNMFRRLFGGGRAELRLSDPNHVLESGIEILAQPPGKRLEAISLLSGGEKTLTAISLLFATYMVKPSPFCFLDEIDAALDEANVNRFVNLLREFSRSSQFIVITHNKKTVSGADTLLGVTMEESGITKAIALKLERHQGGDASLMIPSADDFLDEDVEYEEGRELAPEPKLEQVAPDA